ncbi:MAG: hypothetical protein AAFV51_10310 [Pseudomonadota bacterium]
MTSTVYLSGGRARTRPSSNDEWRYYEKGVIVRLDLDTGEGDVAFEYESPPECCPNDEPSIVFKAGSRSGDTLFMCTQTEVLELKLPTCELVRHISLPSFNDVHHVFLSPKDTLFVVSTGLDLVLELTRTGELIAEYPTLPEEPFTKFDREVDYRKVPTTKPHRTHPNYGFWYQGSPWATRLEQRDAVRLDNLDERMNIGVQLPHDGVVVGDKVYFTLVDGRIAAFDAAKGFDETARIWNIFGIGAQRSPFGWCRGLKVLDGGKRALVGFSALRSTKIKRNVGWVREQIKQGFSLRSLRNRRVPLGTKFLMVDLETNEILRAYNLEPFGMDAVFSIT